MIRVALVDDSNLKKVDSFLQKYRQTSMFLLSNKADFGVRLTEHRNSGNFKCLWRGDEIVGVFVLARRGTLLARTDLHASYVQEILDACYEENFPITAFGGDWDVLAPLWKGHCERTPRYRDIFHAKDVLYACSLKNWVPPKRIEGTFRTLSASDFESWLPLRYAFLKEVGLADKTPVEQLKNEFQVRTERGHWWGCDLDGRLVAIAGFNAAFGDMAQIGGVFTNPDVRGKGLSQGLMMTLMNDSKSKLQISELILFADENNPLSRRVYENVGFSQIGRYALINGEMT